MGMFTSIRHPIDGRELQIYTGDDQCDWYSVGDKVERYIIKDWFKSGCLFDGVYSSNSILGEDDWVVIKDGVIHSVLRRTEYSREDILFAEQIILGYRWQWYSIRAIVWYYLRQGYGSVRGYFDNRKFEKSIKQLSAEQQQSARFIRPILRTMEYSSMVRKIFTVKELKQVNKKFFWKWKSKG